MSRESRQAALHRALLAKAGEPVLFGDLVREVWGDEPPVRPLPALRNLVRRLRQSVGDEIVTDASGYRLVVRRPGPAQLPADLPDFVGRERELAALAGSDARVLAITGPPGVGKTALAVRLAHRIRDRFPDGQLHVNLRGFAAAPPVTPEQALGRFLRALGVAPENVPLALDDQVALYRETLRGRRVLVLLDNATELSPLVPDVEGCTAIVTSRNALRAGEVGLDVLSGGEAGELLDRLGVDGSSHERAELIRLCAHLPLALRIAGAHLADRHLPDYLADLRGDGRLDALEIEGDAAVRATFELSHRALPERAQELFGLLGQVPGPDFGVEAASALLGEDASGPLGQLVAANLVHRAGTRHSLHDLLREYALGLGAPVTSRLGEYYLLNADAAARTLNPELHRLPVPALPRDLPAHDLSDMASALAWFEAERANVVAAVLTAGARPIAWQLTDAMRSCFLHHTGNVIDWFTTARAGLAAARALGDVGAEAAMSASLGLAHWRSSQFAEALPEYRRAVELTRQRDDPGALKSFLGNLGIIHWELGDLAEAAEAMRASLAIESSPNALYNLSCVLLDLGPLDLAVSYGEEALRVSTELGLTAGIAFCLRGLAVTHLFTGRHDLVAEYQDRVAEVATAELGPVFFARGTETQAFLRLEQGHLDEAEALARRSIEMGVECADDIVEVDGRITLGMVLERQGRAREAADQHEHALAISRKSAFARGEVQSLTCLAADHRALGDLAVSLRCATEADERAERGQLRVRQVQAVGELALTREALGDHEEAERQRLRAVELALATGRRGVGTTVARLGLPQPPANGG
ncbi:tetratricopeptide repeat protein [Lentzea sp. HUAS12]|uniref:ATP-binding protein n=1 Tax=Lentzea sp. HUAS12 TaxID=2951806 RepID=UPI00209DB9F5|nr:tetratricopeptide repeat protein [Lentzea sp. HUAS12]USX49570.1 tetratricopeptide repeat protein [Lentzea sp. HUAS12]